jgi:hypothetical protein
VAASQASSQEEADSQPAATTSTATSGAVVTQSPQVGPSQAPAVSSS